MARGKADIIEIIVLSSYTHTLLRRSCPTVFPDFPSKEEILELIHSRIREEKAGISGRQKGRGGNNGVLAGRKKVQEFLSYLMMRKRQMSS